MNKNERQQAIRDIIEEYSVSRQYDLVKHLQDAGVKVTQATISRDIKEMHLMKVPSPTGGYRYSLPLQQGEDKVVKLADTLHSGMLSIKRHREFVALTMRPGSGPVTAMLIKKMQYKEVFTALGDDSDVLVICQSDSAADNFARSMQELAE